MKPKAAFCQRPKRCATSAPARLTFSLAQRPLGRPHPRLGDGGNLGRAALVKHGAESTERYATTAAIEAAASLSSRYLGLCLQQLWLAYSLVLLFQLKGLLCVQGLHVRV